VPAHHSIVTSALQALDPGHAANALDGAFDKCTNFNETGVMVDALVDDYPALASIVSRLAVRLEEELRDDASRDLVVMGCAFGLLSLVEYGHAEEMRRTFGDPS
jgi:hypothetical protein